jgi:dihydrofolate reductase
MEIIIIAAMSKNGVIGNENSIPWHLKEDFELFKNSTLENPVIMGRKTFESIGNKPLPNRENIIITRKQIEGFKCFDSIEKALEHCKKSNYKKAFLIGGARIYEEGLNFANKVMLTIIDKDYEGDTKFPKIDDKIWSLKERIQAYSNENEFFYSFNTFIKK